MNHYLLKLCGVMLVMMFGMSACTENTPVKESSVTIEPESVTETSITFLITPSEAESVYYIVTDINDAMLSPDEISRLGQSADATNAKTYTKDGLDMNSTYRIIAIAHNAKGYSFPAAISMTTAVPVPVVSLEEGETTFNSLTFSLTSSDASKAAYVCVEKSESLPEAEEILSSGVTVEAGKTVVCTVTDLNAETEYAIVAAVEDMAGGNPQLSGVLYMTTGTAPYVEPKVGDFYYSDGTWSSELNKSKTPIGLVFYTGEASDYKDRVSFYKQKDGSTAMEKINGYVIALKDATLVNGSNDGVWWSFFDSRYDGTCSTEINDFLGYTNTKSIVASAAGRGGLSDANTSYPATYYATERYERNCPAPKSSSGWFLPSAYQLQYIYDNVYFNKVGVMNAWLEKSFEILGDKADPMYVEDSEYWTSTESTDNNGYSYWAYYFCFDSRNITPGFISDYRKNANLRVRSVLVF